MSGAVTPTPIGNHCIGKQADRKVNVGGVLTTIVGDPIIQFKCMKNLDTNGDPVYTCATWRYFRVTCSKINRQCNSLSGGYVAAVTVCNQKLF